MESYSSAKPRGREQWRSDGSQALEETCGSLEGPPREVRQGAGTEPSNHGHVPRSASEGECFWNSRAKTTLVNFSEKEQGFGKLCKGGHFIQGLTGDGARKQGRLLITQGDG